jgi:hypothetical protein
MSSLTSLFNTAKSKSPKSLFGDVLLFLAIIVVVIAITIAYVYVILLGLKHWEAWYNGLIELDWWHALLFVHLLGPRVVRKLKFSYK